MPTLEYFDCIAETSIIIDPNQQEDNPDYQASGRSTIITRLINLNDSDSCDVLSNFIFVLLLLLLLGRHKRSNTEKWRNGAIGVIAQFINLINGAMELENRAMVVIAPFIDSINRAMGLRT